MPNNIEKIFNVAMLFYTTSAIMPFIADDTGAFAYGNPVAFMVQAAFYLVAFCFIALHRRTVMRGAWNAKWILLLVLIAVTSTAWSQDPLFTLRRSAVLLATTAFGIYFGSRFTVPQQLRLLGWTCALLLFTSLFMALVFPRYGVDHRLFPGAWVGDFSHKNILAKVMVLSVLVFHFLRKSVPSWLRWLGIGAALCLLALSRSASGPLVLVAMIVVLLVTTLVRLRFTFSIPTLIVASLLVAGTVSVVGTTKANVFRLLRRNSTLTGRTDVWKGVLHSIAKRPVLGYGYDAFWTTVPGEASSVFQEIGWYPSHAHNGFLNVTLELGIVGVSIFLASYTVLWHRVLRLMRKTTDVIPIWLWTYLAFIFFYNLDEGPILAQNNVFWILYTSTAVSISLYASVPFGRRAIDLASPKETLCSSIPPFSSSF